METRLIIAYSLIFLMVAAAAVIAATVIRKRAKRRAIDAGRSDYRK